MSLKFGKPLDELLATFTTHTHNCSTKLVIPIESRTVTIQDSSGHYID